MGADSGVGGLKSVATQNIGQRQPPGGDTGALDVDGVDGESVITLGLLDAVHQNSDVSQRSLSAELGIALGLTNAYLKRCVRKGLVKVRSAPANRYAYYLTPKGFTEKSQLTARYLSGSFSFYRRARGQCDDLIAQCADHGWRRIALYGVGDLAEIAILCAMRHPVQVMGVADDQAKIDLFLDLNVARSVKGFPRIDGALLTESRSPQKSYDLLSSQIAPDRILVPDLLHVTRPDVRIAQGSEAGS